MTFIKQLVIRKSLPLIYNNHNHYQNQIVMLQENTNTTLYNPILGSNLGIPLNLFQLIYTTTHYNLNIITLDFILMQFAIGIFTYGYDRFLDALQYNSLKDVEFIDKKKRDYYDFLLKNPYFNIIIIYLSYFYLFLLMIDHVETYPIFILLTSTVFYKNLKQNFGEFKAIYIGFFAAMKFYKKGHVDIFAALYMGLIFTIFASVSSLFTLKIDKDLLRKIFAIFTIIAGVYIYFNE